MPNIFINLNVLKRCGICKTCYDHHTIKNMKDRTLSAKSNLKYYLQFNIDKENDKNFLKIHHIIQH